MEGRNSKGSCPTVLCRWTAANPTRNATAKVISWLTTNLSKKVAAKFAVPGASATTPAGKGREGAYRVLDILGTGL